MKRKLVYLLKKYPSARSTLSHFYPIRVWLELNGIFERLGNLIVGDVIIRVDEFGGEFRISPRSHLFMRVIRSGQYEPHLSSKFMSFVKPGMDVVDVGANVGFYTIAAAKKGARVLSIEPSEGAFRCLQENVRRNGVEDRVILFNGIASDTNGTSNLHVIKGMEEYSSINPIYENYAVGREQDVSTVAARTLDSLIDEFGLSPGLLKADTEGAELLVFRGATKTLAAHRPIVMSELSDALMASFGADGDEVVKIFLDLGYLVQSPSGESLQKKGVDGYGEILCLPRE